MSRLDHLVVLAGGKATRLGPITATMSKALVTVGSQPMLVRQIVGVDAKHVTVVVNPTTQAQVEQLLERVFPESYWNVVVQDEPRGPVDAVRVGLEQPWVKGHTAVIMADALYDFNVVSEQATKRSRTTWVAVTPGKGQPPRSFCWVDDRGRRWEDSADWCDDDLIFTGLIVTDKPSDLRSVATAVRASSGETPMSALLERVRAIVVQIPWHDTGDLPALARTTRELFIKRDHHETRLNDPGWFTKQGCSRAQVNYLLDRSAERNPLFPRVRESATDAAGGKVTTEFIDLPTLAELWLYWPGTDDVWCHIIERLLATVSEHLWPLPEGPYEDVSVVNQRLLVHKLLERLDSPELETRPNENAVAKLVELLKPIVDAPMPARIHGDLNMTNILYSARTDTFKLLDPRGEAIGDLRYDLAKLRYSWHGFVTTVHGVPETYGELLHGHRSRPMKALDKVIGRVFPTVRARELAAIEASIFWSALPLHPPEQRDALMICGYDRLDEAKR